MRILTTAAFAASLLAMPALAAAPGAPGGPTKTMVAASTAPKAKGTSKMARCAQQWHALGDKGQAGYKDKAKTMKSKKGNSMSGYNAFTSECMKKG